MGLMKYPVNPAGESFPFLRQFVRPIRTTNIAARSATKYVPTT
jgi:hypothetical protein